VEAVIGEPVSAARFPCYAGKYREISAFDADIGNLTLTFASKSKASAAISL
jgi:hypothetical protein